jgi:hypothetical protein
MLLMIGHGQIQPDRTAIGFKSDARFDGPHLYLLARHHRVSQNQDLIEREAKPHEDENGD